ncbi:unnamed protein product [Urochloa humidicola]
MVLPGPRSHRRHAQEPRALPRLPLHPLDHTWMGVHDRCRLQRGGERRGGERAGREPEGGGILGGGVDIFADGGGGSVRRGGALPSVSEAAARAVSELCPLLAVTLVLNGVQHYSQCSPAWPSGAGGRRSWRTSTWGATTT